MTTTSKYTPTPWVAMKDGRVRDARGETIAALFGDVRAIDDNTLLVAAAPDLLAACEALLAIPGIVREAPFVVAVARAAVEKAKGETK